MNFIMKTIDERKELIESSISNIEGMFNGMYVFGLVSKFLKSELIGNKQQIEPYN